MTATIEAVYENGILRPMGPLPLSEGQAVKLQMDYEVSSEQETERVERILALLQDVQEEAAKLPQEFWDLFDRELQESRMLFTERDEFDSDGQ